MNLEFFKKIKPILLTNMLKKIILNIVQKKNIILGNEELDITDDIIRIVDQKIM